MAKGVVDQIKITEKKAAVSGIILSMRVGKQKGHRFFICGLRELLDYDYLDASSRATLRTMPQHAHRRCYGSDNMAERMDIHATDYQEEIARCQHLPSSPACYLEHTRFTTASDITKLTNTLWNKENYCRLRSDSAKIYMLYLNSV